MQIVVSLSGSEVDLDLVGVFMLQAGESVDGAPNTWLGVKGETEMIFLEKKSLSSLSITLKKGLQE